MNKKDKDFYNKWVEEKIVAYIDKNCLFFHLLYHKLLMIQHLVVQQRHDKL